MIKLIFWWNLCLIATPLPVDIEWALDHGIVLINPEEKGIDLFDAPVLQSSSKGFSQNLVLLVGGFETKTGEQVCQYHLSTV